MKAAIDIGSNSVRMLLGEVVGDQVVPLQYFRHITRLASGYDPQTGISAGASARTLSALETFSQRLDQINPVCCRAVATEAVRRAVIGEQFVTASQKVHPGGIIGPFALQGAVVADEGKEDIVIFDVSMRIPGSPGTASTPYSGYLYGDSISYGERIAMDLKVGDKVLFQKYAGTEFKLEGEELLILNEKDVLALIEG